MATYRFGSGQLFVRPITGVGASYALGTLQDVSVDMSADIKTMYGSFDTPDIAALGKLKIDLKAKFGVIDSGMYNSIFYGATASSGVKLFVGNEPQTITSGTATATNTTGFQDLSVMYAASGVPLINIGTGTPTAGQYTVSAGGVYTFATADDAAPVLLNYTYITAATPTLGTTLQRRTRLMGGTQFFSIFLYNAFNGLQCNMEFYRCLSSKISQATKNDDFTVPEMDITVFNSPSGLVYSIYDQSVIL